MRKGIEEMKDNYILENPRKNPFAERMKNGYTIIIDREPDDDDDEVCERPRKIRRHKRASARKFSIARKLRRKKSG